MYKLNHNPSHIKLTTRDGETNYCINFNFIDESKQLLSWEMFTLSNNNRKVRNISMITQARKKLIADHIIQWVNAA